MTLQEGIKRIRGLGERLEIIIEYIIVPIIMGAVLLAIVVGVPMYLPESTENNFATSPWFLVPFAIFYLLSWTIALFLVMETAAYVYRFNRPFWSPSKRRPTYGASTIKTRAGFICSCLASYGLTLYGFAVAYILISIDDSNAFNVKTLRFLDAIYFTVVTAATVGFGDIIPTSKIARATVTAEIIVSFLYVIFLFSTASALTNPSHERKDKLE